MIKDYEIFDVDNKYYKEMLALKKDVNAVGNIGHHWLPCACVSMLMHLGKDNYRQRVDMLYPQTLVMLKDTAHLLIHELCRRCVLKRFRSSMNIAATFMKGEIHGDDEYYKRFLELRKTRDETDIGDIDFTNCHTRGDAKKLCQEMYEVTNVNLAHNQWKQKFMWKWKQYVKTLPDSEKGCSYSNRMRNEKIKLIAEDAWKSYKGPKTKEDFIYKFSVRYRKSLKYKSIACNNSVD